MASIKPLPPLEASNLASVFPDISPIPQSDGPYPVCAIAYSDEFVVAYNYLRAALSAKNGQGECSERTLRLTALCLRLNPANYTVWHFRRRIIKELSTARTSGKDKDSSTAESESSPPRYCSALVASDLGFAARLGGSNPKNYQIWYHRRALLEPLFEGSDGGAVKEPAARDELSYVARVLNEDAKNYHAWSHRQWVIQTLNHPLLWAEELAFVHSLVERDPRNNSAWNQRWFASHCGLHTPLSAKDAKRECEYALEGAALDPYNESPWRYLIGVLGEQLNSTGEEDETQGLVDFCMKRLVQVQHDLEKRRASQLGLGACASLAAAHADMLEMKGDKASMEEASTLVHLLATEHDTIRRKYWSKKERELMSKIGKLKL